MFYHVWFSTKRRKWLLVGDVESTVKMILIETAREKGIKLAECQPMVDHIHMLVEAASEQELSWVMKLLKGRSSYDVFRRMPELKLDAGENSLWQRGFASRVVPEDQLETVSAYIRTQDQRLEEYER